MKAQAASVETSTAYPSDYLSVVPGQSATPVARLGIAESPPSGQETATEGEEAALNIEAAVAFYKSIFGKEQRGHAVLAFISPEDGSCHHESIDLADPNRSDLARRHIAKYIDTHNCFVSIGIYAEGRRWNRNKRRGDVRRGGWEFRTEGMFAQGRFFICDRDGHELSPNMPPPTYTLETSAGRYQDWYELAQPVDGDTIRDGNDRIAAACGVGTEAIDCTRILRLPGTRNLWPRNKGEIVRIVAATGAIYGLKDFAHLPPREPEKPKRKKRTRHTCANPGFELVGIPTSLKPPLGAVSGEWLRECDRNAEFVHIAAVLMGMDATVPLGKKFLCLLHPETNPSASFGQADDGYWYYHDWHAGKYHSQAILTIAELYAAWVTGEVRKFTETKPSHAVWKMRLLCDLGVLTPLPISLPPLRIDATADQKTVYDGVKFLFGVKWLWDWGVASPLAWDFMSRWCGLPEARAREGVQYLIKQGIIQAERRKKTRFGKEMTLFLPGNPLSTQPRSP